MKRPAGLLPIAGVLVAIAVAGCASTTTMPGGDAYMKPSWTRDTAKNTPAYTACVTNALAQHGVKFLQTPVGAGYVVIIGTGHIPEASVEVTGGDNGSSVNYSAPRAGDYNDQVAAGCL